MLAKTLRAVGTVITGMILIISLLLILPWDKYVIQSGSMEPTLPVGSLIYVNHERPEDIEAGDIITFYANENSKVPTTHRVVSNDTTGQQFTTKGDANEKEDLFAVSYRLYQGKMMFHIPLIGFAMANLTTVNGKIFLISGLLVGIIFVEMASLLEKKKNK